MAPLATDRCELPRAKTILQQDNVSDVVLSAHRQPRTIPRKPRRVVVPPELPEPATHTRDEDLEVPLVPDRPLGEQTTTSCHNPILLLVADPNVPPVKAGPQVARTSDHKRPLPRSPQRAHR